MGLKGEKEKLLKEVPSSFDDPFGLFGHLNVLSSLFHLGGPRAKCAI